VHRFLLEKLIIARLAKEFPAFFETRRCIVVFTGAFPLSVNVDGQLHRGIILAQNLALAPTVLEAKKYCAG
jgi:hypothetical protein